MSTQPNSARKIVGYTQAISANVTNLLTEVARASASAPHTAPPSASNNSNDEILHQLQKMSLEMASMRTDLDIIKTKLDLANEMAPPAAAAPPNMVDLMEMEDPAKHYNFYKTAEEYNELARRYNKELRYHSDYIAPLHNARNELVFGFPTTLGDFANLHNTAETLLCSAFGLTWEPEALANFCGFHDQTIYNIAMHKITGNNLVEFRVRARKKRLADIEAAGAPTASTRMLAARHNSEARKHNAEADCSDYDIIPIHDERNLVVPGFPREWDWFFRPHRRDVLYFLEEYWQEVEPKGCLERFEDFVGVPRIPKTEFNNREWFL